MAGCALCFGIVSLALFAFVNGECIRHIFGEGVVKSDNYPNGYQRGLKCRTWIHAPTGKVVDISVVDLDVASSSNGDCLNDSVRIFDGYRSTDPLLDTLCGSVTSGSYRTTQSKAYIAFKTDRLDDGGTGYKFAIAFINPHQTDSTTASTTTMSTTQTTSGTTAYTTTTTTPSTTATTQTTTGTTQTTTETTQTTTETTQTTTGTTQTTTGTTQTTTSTSAPTTTMTTTSVTTTTSSTSTTASTSGAVPDWHIDSCGYSSVSNAGDYELPTSRVYGGIAATPHEFPWQVLITRNNVLVCGGSVINKNWIITAAHCHITSGNTYSVIVGAHRLQDSTEQSRQTFQPAAVYSNSNYSSVTHDYDIALIKTDREIQMNDYVQPICPPNLRETFANRKAVVSGWGNVLDSSGRPVLPAVLQYTTLNITTLTYCRNKWRGHGTITDRMVCATDNKHETERDTCSGDSGGPLAVKRANGRFVLVGITSFGIGCASGFPGVYSRVSYLLDWVQNILDAH